MPLQWLHRGQWTQVMSGGDTGELIGLWSLVALSPEGQGLPPAHPSPHTCRKSHVSLGSCPPSGVGARGLPPAMALSAPTQSCSRGPTAPKSPAKGGGHPAPHLQAQWGEIRQVPSGTRPLDSVTSHIPGGVWVALGTPGGRAHLPPGVLPTCPNPLAPLVLCPTTPYLVGGLWGPSAVGLGWAPAMARPVRTRSAEEGQGQGSPVGVPGQAGGAPATSIGTPSGHGMAQPRRYLGHPCGRGGGRDARRSCPGAGAGRG